ncbi:MAG: GNAT family N-acetyltransferase [Actinomycetales bacterium]
MDAGEDSCIVSNGFSDEERSTVGQLYWGAFGGKLSAAFADPATGEAVVSQSLRPDRVITARQGGQVVGLCGFYDSGIGAADVTWPRLRARLPRGRALWASGALSILRRHDVPDTMVLDGLCVAPGLRGQGVGSLLLEAVVHRARARDLAGVQLSVIDANPRAAQLYRRHGFRPVHHATLGPLRHLFGFDGYTTMRKEIA